MNYLNNYCKTCGAFIVPGNAFCQKCGAAFTQNNQNDNMLYGTNSTNNTLQENKYKRSGKICLAIISLILFAVSLAILLTM